MQLLMRRPEIEGFISVAPPANLYDFSFLAPCPSSGLIVHGDKDAVVPHKDVTGLVDKLKTQKGIIIEQKVIPGANHFFDGKVEPLMQSVSAYLDKRLKGDRGRERGIAHDPGSGSGIRTRSCATERFSRSEGRRAPRRPVIGRGAPVVVGNVIGRPFAASAPPGTRRPAPRARRPTSRPRSGGLDRRGAKRLGQHPHQRRIARAAAGRRSSRAARRGRLRRHARHAPRR